MIVTVSGGDAVVVAALGTGNDTVVVTDTVDERSSPTVLRSRSAYG